MIKPFACLTVSALALFPAISTAQTGAAPKPTLTLDAINPVGFSPLPDQPAKRPVPEIIKASILLDRARFSPGSIDGIDGENFRKAVSAYQTANGLPASGRLDQPTWDKLTAADSAPVLVRRDITAADLKGPFVKRIPAKFEQQASLKRMGYTNVQEELGEQYHVAPSLLRALNKDAQWRKDKSQIVVPQVVADRPAAKVTQVRVDKAAHAVEAYAGDGKLVAFYPASIGSEEKPAPSGAFTIRRVTHNPNYTYNPKYAFKGVKSKKPFEIAPGPNNPVGSVWMDLSSEGYGIHGTPEPSLVGKTQSHGCIRLTNWDAQDLGSMVGPGTAVSFEDGPVSPTVAPAASTGGPARLGQPGMPPNSTAASPAPTVTPPVSAEQPKP